MKREFVLYEVSDGIASITVNRPEVINAISPQVYREVDDAFTQAEQDDKVIVIVVAGAGDSFGSGHDMGSKQSKIEEAKQVAEKLVEEKLAACVTILPRAESVYSWKGKIEKTEESVLLIKTRDGFYSRLEARLKELHSYECPEIIAVKPEKASRAYSQWLEESTQTV